MTWLDVGVLPYTQSSLIIMITDVWAHYVCLFEKVNVMPCHVFGPSSVHSIQNVTHNPL